EHAVDPFDKGLTALLVHVRQDLRVTARVELVAPRDKIFSQDLEVVDLAVLGRPDRLRLVGDRLAPGLDIHDAQAPGPQREVRATRDVPVVGATVHERFEHAPNATRVPGAKYSGNSAHGSTLSPARSCRVECLGARPVARGWGGRARLGARSSR